MSRHTHARAVLGAMSLSLALSACCSGAVDAAPTVAPPASPGAPACLALCERLSACHGALGTVPRDIDRDCSTACAPGGQYASLSESTWACAAEAECAAVWQCVSPEMAAQLLGALGSGTAPSDAPSDWPAGFPLLPGAVAIPSSPMGPVHVSMVRHEARTPASLAEAYAAALTAAGWTIPEQARDHDEEAERFVATRAGNSVSVSFYADGDGTSAVVQTMQLGALFAP